MKIAIIGAGNLGVSIAKGIIDNNLYTTFYLTKRQASTIKSWEDFPKVYTTNSNEEAVKNADILILSVQPNHLKKVLEEIKPFLHDKHQIISTATGFKIHQIESILGTEHSIIRAMPNTAIAVSKSMTCLCANSKGLKRIPVAEALFGLMGKTVVIDEALMQAATVLCSSGIAFWMRMIRATTQGGIQMGFDAQIALEMSVHTCLGAASLLVNTASHPEREIDKVTTPKGCTISGLNEMEFQGLSSSLIKGLLKSYEKINEIAQS
jgi:pyrroline-5-carboxylate reductase